MGEVRGIGMITAFDIDQRVVGSEFGPALHRRFRHDEHMLVRSYKNGQAVGFGPPLILTKEDVDEILARLERAITAAEDEHGFVRELATGKSN